MTDKAQPGGIRTEGVNREWGSVAGQFSNGFVQPANDPTIAALESTVDETTFTAFDATTTPGSFDVTIGPGEGFVNGWVARDAPTTVTLAASTADQTVYLGWDHMSVESDRVIIGLGAEFDTLTAAKLPKVPLWSFDTDASGVTAVRDERRLGPHIDAVNTGSGTEYLPIAALNPDESIEIPIRLEPNETVEVGRWGAYNAADGTTPAGLKVQLLDDTDTVVATAETPDAEVSHADTNTGASAGVWKVRALNSTGMILENPGVGTVFQFSVIQ